MQEGFKGCFFETTVNRLFEHWAKKGRISWVWLPCGKRQRIQLSRTPRSFFNKERNILVRLFYAGVVSWRKALISLCVIKTVVRREKNGIEGIQDGLGVKWSTRGFFFQTTFLQTGDGWGRIKTVLLCNAQSFCWADARFKVVLWSPVHEALFAPVPERAKNMEWKSLWRVYAMCMWERLRIVPL